MAVLVGCLGISVAAWRTIDQQARHESAADFERRTDALALHIERRMLAYEQMLRAASGLQTAAGPVTREQWRAFVAALDLPRTLPEIAGVGWAIELPADELAAHQTALRDSGIPQYAVRPMSTATAATAGSAITLGRSQGGAQRHAPIVYIEPLVPAHENALGLDLYSDPVRRAALQRARDSGRASLTEPVRLVQDLADPRPLGLVLFMPVYDERAAQAQRAAPSQPLAGWVYCAFRISDFMAGLVPDSAVDLAVRLYDGAQPLRAAKLYSNAVEDANSQPAFNALRPLQVADRSWTLEVESTPLFERRLRFGEPRAVLIGGVLASLLVFAMVWSLASTRARALALADRMTQQLRDANDRLEEKVRVRTESLAVTNARLAAENAQRDRAERQLAQSLDRERSLNMKLQAVAAAFGRMTAPADLVGKLDAIAAEVRAVLGCRRALIAIADNDGNPLVRTAGNAGATDDDAWSEAVLERGRRNPPPQPGWRDRHGDPVLEELGLDDLMIAPIGDGAGLSRGWIAVSGCDSPALAREDELVLSQLALLVGSALSQHQLLSLEQRARAEAEAANRAKDEMLAVVSHELRTPLNAIQGWIHILRRQRTVDESIVRRAVEVLQRNLDSQIQVVNDLLDTARLASGKLHLDLQPLELSAVVHGSVDIVRPAAVAKGVRLAVELPPQEIRLLGDPHRLKQVLWNLLNNAVKFTPARGSIRVRAQLQSRHCIVQVIDSGQGIDPAFLPHVFERFSQGGDATTRNVGGLGLGLALVRHIVQAHGGTVTAASEGRGRGACFTVTLPLPGRQPLQAAPQVDVAEDAGADAPPSLDGVWVLLVEDHPDSRELWAQALREWGARVVDAADAAQAVAGYRSIPADAQAIYLLCDIALPGESGFEVIAKLRQLEAQRGDIARFDAIAISAFTRNEDLAATQAAGFSRHLCKPLSPAALASVFASAIR
ncbi:MAG TPA: CHASE domain-containing protein [Burkholderiaceae bacterium]|nr:CHASE domain-containing protein [Burkholderiaceae bacterium]